MVSYGDLRRWNPVPLHESVGVLNKRCNDLVGLSDELSDAAKLSRWHGDAAAAAANNLGYQRKELELLIGEVAAMRQAMGEAADAVTGLTHGIAEADELARRWQCRIEDNGTVHEGIGVCLPDAGDQAAYDAERQRVKAELTDRVTEILRRADDIDNDLATVAQRCLDGFGMGTPAYDSLTETARAGADAGHLSMLEPPPGGTPAANAAWFSTLGEAERNWILTNRPDLIGNLDGVPADYRDRANRARIPAERARLLAAREEKVKNPWDLNLLAELAAIDAKLDSLRDIEEMLTRTDRHLLLLDTTGERAKAAISIGDVDKANHVAVFTPGMNSTVNDRMQGYDRDMEDLRENAHDELQRNNRSNESVAVVTWLGYEPPRTDVNPWDAAGRGEAEEGARRLAPFLEGINTSRPDDPHLTALGHSYGSLTTGIALRDHATGVDEAVVFGSPGLGVDDTSQLKAPQGHIHNMAAEGDLVAHVGDITENIPPFDKGWHGQDPSLMPGMHQLSTHEYTAPDGRHFTASHGHSEYLNSGDGKYTTSEWNLANIVAGTGTGAPG